MDTPSAGEVQTCTVKELMSIITAPCGGLTMLPDTAMNEVWPRIYIGDAGSARNPVRLSSLGVTHVINAASGKDKYHVMTDVEAYSKHGVQVLAVEATDMDSFNISLYFEKTTSYIDDAFKRGGKVLVHCREGVSRSSTIVLAYLMISQKMTAQEAMTTVRQKREVCPNDGFLQQLCLLNNRLHQQGHFADR